LSPLSRLVFREETIPMIKPSRSRYHRSWLRISGYPNMKGPKVRAFENGRLLFNHDIVHLWIGHLWIAILRGGFNENLAGSNSAE
jgi:hypothetical protein